MAETRFLLLRALLALGLATALAALALWRRALTRGGLLLAWLCAVVIAFCGGLTGFFALAATFVFTILADRLGGKTARAVGAALHEKTGRRDAAEIACNVLTGAVMLLLRELTGRDCFLWAYAGAMAASLADSTASGLGVLSAAPPRDILTLRPAVKGLSGGVTLLGLGASLLGALIVAAICAAGWGLGPGALGAFTLAGFLGALFDSVLGSAAQAKYRCPSCGALTEKSLHCGVPGTVERGLPRFSNDLVNLCNNLFGAAAALGVYELI